MRLRHLASTVLPSLAASHCQTCLPLHSSSRQQQHRAQQQQQQQEEEQEGKGVG
jgi:hypothetical protein